MTDHEALIASGLHECASDCFATPPPVPAEQDEAVRLNDPVQPRTEAGRAYLAQQWANVPPMESRDAPGYIARQSRRAYEQDVADILAIEAEAATPPPADHPYEAKADGRCIHCGQYGARIHTPPPATPDWDYIGALISDALDYTNDGAVIAKAIKDYLAASPLPAAPPLNVERLTVTFRNLGLRSPRDFAIQTEAEYARLTEQEDGDG